MNTIKVLRKKLTLLQSQQDQKLEFLKKYKDDIERIKGGTLIAGDLPTIRTLCAIAISIITINEVEAQLSWLEELPPESGAMSLL